MKTTSKKNEDDLKKNEDDLKKNQKLRQPHKKIKNEALLYLCLFLIAPLSENALYSS